MNIKSLLLIPIAFLVFQTSCNNDGKNKAPGSDSTNSATTQFEPGTTGDPDQIDTAHFTSLNCDPNRDFDSLDVTLIGQLGYWWCWAACGEMVMSSLGRDVAQCVQAENQVRQELQCCETPPPPPFGCDDTGWPQFEKYGFKADTTHDKALCWEDVKKQINCLKTPFCFSKKFLGSDEDGHMMVICGYKISDGDTLVLKYDPEPVGRGSQQWISYASYVSGPDFTHWDDYYNVRRINN